MCKHFIGVLGKFANSERAVSCRNVPFFEPPPVPLMMITAHRCATAVGCIDIGDGDLEIFRDISIKHTCVFVCAHGS